MLGYGDLWDASLAYGANQATEVSVGVYAPRVKGFLTPIVTRISMLSQDWQESSSYKERLLGASLGLISTKHHDLAYTLGWRTLTDPSQMSSRSIRRQLGHGLVSSLKYTFKIDRRNSPIRPTKGYAFLSTTHVGGLTPDPRSLRFLRQVWLNPFIFLQLMLLYKFMCNAWSILTHRLNDFGVRIIEIILGVVRISKSVWSEILKWFD